MMMTSESLMLRGLLPAPPRSGSSSNGGGSAARVHGLESLLSSLQARGVPLSTDDCNMLLWALAEAGRTDQALAYLKRMLAPQQHQHHAAAANDASQPRPAAAQAGSSRG